MKKIRTIIFWVLLISLIGILVGSASAFFLWTLDLVTRYRISNSRIIYFLPLAGLAVGLTYHYFGDRVSKGNNLLIEEFHSPKDVIPLRMAPMVYIGTIISHLFGASVGREGTALQMGGAIADQFTHYFKLTVDDRKALIIIGISAGFASVFGTPIAGAIFALEVFHIRKLQYKYALHSLLAAFVAHYVCLAWGIHHSHYSIPFVPEVSFMNLFWTINAGIIFGLIALLFSKFTHLFTNVSDKIIKYAPLKPFVGGIILVLLYYFFDLNKFMGLGLPSIANSFIQPMPVQDFLIKLLLTAFTIGLGFKGGEVTPLFFIGATLGNALIWFIPLPLPLLVGLGFVSVFAGATNTVVACIVMGLELFGMGSGVYIVIACLVAFLFSGRTSVYTSQKK